MEYEKFMKTIAILLAGCIAVSLNAGELTMMLTNREPYRRTEVIEIDAGEIMRMAGIARPEKIMVKGPDGKEVASQITHDGLLLIDASLPPDSAVCYTVTEGTPGQFPVWCSGNQYPFRKDDFAWENDLIAFRIYGPALRKSGEKSYGTDVWVKNTPEPVVAKRYEGYRTDRANNSFHKDNGNGLDAYAVGPTLGCGAPALMDGDSIAFPYCYENYKILDNGPLRMTVEFDYPPVNVFGETGVVEHRRLTLDKGSHFCRQDVWYDGLKHPHRLIAGVVIHSADTTNIVLGDRYVHYADPTDRPGKHKFKIFVATLFPRKIRTEIVRSGLSKGVVGHAVGIYDNYKGEQFTYYFGSAWSKYDVPTHEDWHKCIENFLSRKKVHIEIIRGLKKIPE